jgi:fructose-1-phosphate kinase PfkB-like protein
LKRIVSKGRLWIIKPNVEELRELVDKKIADKTGSLVKASRRLLNKAEIVLVSRGEKGAVVITEEGAWRCEILKSGEVLYTVGCGDYMLAGFLQGLKEKGDLAFALEGAVKLGTARAMGLTDKKQGRVDKQIKVKVERIS